MALRPGVNPPESDQFEGTLGWHVDMAQGWAAVAAKARGYGPTNAALVAITHALLAGVELARHPKQL